MIARKKLTTPRRAAGAAFGLLALAVAAADPAAAQSMGVTHMGVDGAGVYAAAEPIRYTSGYGQSQIDLGGYGASSQSAVLSVSKAAVITLPADARDVIVSDPEIAKAILRTTRQMVLIGAKVGQTNIFVFDDGGQQILNLELRVEYDLRPLEAMLAARFPSAKVKVESILGEFVLSGAAANPSEAAAIEDVAKRYLTSSIVAAGGQASLDTVTVANQLSVAAEDQVMLKVRIAEMRRSVAKQFGVDTAVAGKLIGGVSTGTSAISIANSFGVNGSALGGLSGALTAANSDTSISALVKAFERHGVMRTLAEPVLTAVTGETASFLAGGEYPVPTDIDDQGNVSYTYREYGVALEFTPVVLDEGRISLRISTEVSELTSEGALTGASITIPGVSKRRANTTVEMPSGGSMAMAGLLQQRDQATNAGLPGVKNIPIIGQLFSSTDFLRNESELVIIVTPYLVRPGKEADFRLPTDGFAPASDSDIFLMGRLHSAYGAGGSSAAAARDALRAPLGFIID